METCPCGTQKPFMECCGPYLTDGVLPPTPESLMRSRYTAYTQANIDYIQDTMAAPANKDFDPEEARDWANYVTWLGLEVVSAAAEGDKGQVEFMAHFSHDNNKQVLHEVSEFHRVNQKWFYVNGMAPGNKPLDKSHRKLSRNDRCHCGSQKKYKKCCGLTE